MAVACGIGDQSRENLMRWNYLLPRFILGAAIWAFFAFALDPLLHFGIVSSGEYALAARVEMNQFRTGIFPPRASVRNVRVANRQAPGTNLIEFDALHCELNGAALLKKDYVIENAEVTGLRFGTAREDSGILDREPLFDFSFPNLSFDLGIHFSGHGKKWLDSALDYAKGQLDPRQLETVQVAEELRGTWSRRFDDLSARAKAIEAKSKTLEDSADPKGNALEKVNAYRQLAADANKLLAEIEQVRADLRQLPQLANQDMKSLDEARQRDMARIREKVELLQMNPQELSEALLGPELVQRMRQAAGCLAWVHKFMTMVTVDPEPERLRGIDVVFEQRPRLPRFLIRNLKFDGVAELSGGPLNIAGQITGITTEPDVLGEPVVMQASGQGKSQIEVKAILDQTRPEAAYELAVAYRNSESMETQIGDDQSLALTVAAAATECRANLRLAGNQLIGKIDLIQSPVRVSMARHEDASSAENATAVQVNQAIEGVLAGIQNLNSSLSIQGSIEHPELRLSSNLGPQIADGLNTVLVRQIEQQRLALSAKIDAATRAKSDEFRKLLNDRHGEVVKLLSSNDDRTRKLLTRLTADNPLDLKRLIR
jgi:uncharacterized protein (TIGR03545 family)